MTVSVAGNNIFSMVEITNRSVNNKTLIGKERAAADFKWIFKKYLEIWT